MKKLITTIVVGLPLLAAASLADANGWGHGGVQASVSIGIPIGNYGYAAIGTGPTYYPAPVYYPSQAYYPAPVYYPAPYYYAPRPVYYNPGYGPGYGRGYDQGRRYGSNHNDRYNNRRNYYDGRGHSH